MSLSRMDASFSLAKQTHIFSLSMNDGQVQFGGGAGDGSMAYMTQLNLRRTVKMPLTRDHGIQIGHTSIISFLIGTRHQPPCLDAPKTPAYLFSSSDSRASLSNTVTNDADTKKLSMPQHWTGTVSLPMAVTYSREHCIRSVLHVLRSPSHSSRLMLQYCSIPTIIPTTRRSVMTRPRILKSTSTNHWEKRSFESAFLRTKFPAPPRASKRHSDIINGDIHMLCSSASTMQLKEDKHGTKKEFARRNASVRV
jgi:hypothetical protein